MYIKATAKSKTLMRGADFHVILPYHDGYPDAKRPYPTLYFLPGFSASAEEIAFALPLRQMSALYGVAVVVPDGENAFYTDHPDQAFRMGEYAGKELVEITRKMFPCLSHEREDTFIGGISMGGYGALINGLRFADTFSKIAMLSPALGFKRQDDEPTPGSPSPKGELLATLGTWEEYRGSYRDYSWAAAEAAKSPEAMPDMFLACGKSDGLITPAKEFATQMESLHTPLAWYEAEGGHDHTFWKQALTPMFRFLTGKEDA